MKDIFIGRLARTFQNRELAQKVHGYYELYQAAIGLHPCDINRPDVHSFRQKHLLEVTMIHDPLRFESILKKELGLTLKRVKLFSKCEEDFYKWPESSSIGLKFSGSDRC